MNKFLKALLYLSAFVVAFVFGYLYPPAEQRSQAKSLDQDSALYLTMPFKEKSIWKNFQNQDGKFTPSDGDTWFVYGWFGAIESNKVTNRYSVFNNRHQGIDFSALENLPVSASAAGEVYYVGEFYGKTVVVKHRDGYFTVYGHLARVEVREGDNVSRGEEIGTVGATGTTNPHLHFELRRVTDQGIYLINPRKLLRTDWSQVVVPDFPANRFYQGDAWNPDDQPDFLLPEGYNFKQ